MEDFRVNRKEGDDNKCYMHIGFKDMRTGYNYMNKCFGSALVRPGDDTEYWFSYSFHHSMDWREVGDMLLRPVNEYRLSTEQLGKIGSEIFYYIKEFISKMN
jgi:hypothetical protein